MNKKKILIIVALLVVIISVVIAIFIAKSTPKKESITTTTSESTTEEPETILLSDIYKNYYNNITGLDQLYAGQVIGHIYSEYLSIDCDLVYGVSDACLAKGAGIHACSTLPGLKTPQDTRATCPIICGHVQIDFKGLKVIDPADTELPEGITITLQMPYGDYVYEIKHVEVMDKSEFKFKNYRANYDNFTPDTAIFYTCYPFGKVDYVKQDRLFLFCNLVSGTQVIDDVSTESTTE